MHQVFSIFAGLTIVTMLNSVSALAVSIPAEEDIDTYFDGLKAVSSYDNAAWALGSSRWEEEAGGNSAVVVGPKGDWLKKIPETPELVALVSKYKDSAFVSIENPSQYIEDGYCLINVVPTETQVDLGRRTKVEECRYRVFCGDVDDMTKNDMYAVELCNMLPSI